MIYIPKLYDAIIFTLRVNQFIATTLDSSVCNELNAYLCHNFIISRVIRWRDTLIMKPHGENLGASMGDNVDDIFRLW